jgi:hypothetical protein
MPGGPQTCAGAGKKSVRRTYDPCVVPNVPSKKPLFSRRQLLGFGVALILIGIGVFRVIHP